MAVGFALEIEAKDKLHSEVISRRIFCALFAITLGACSTGSMPAIPMKAPPTVPTPGNLGSIGHPGCTPSAEFHGRIPEAGFDSPQGSLWMLIFGDFPPVAGHDIKIVWRMTGTGDFEVHATDVDGIESRPIWGPEGHGSSSWAHPGAEIGVGFKFPHAGCWHIHLARSDAQGDVWLAVV